VTLVVTTLAIVVRSKGEVDQSYDISMKARARWRGRRRHRGAGRRADHLSRGAANALEMIADLEAD